ncbi:MAG: ABC transporter ATP-binding protein/permease [Clostridia bacterium]|nr:ABC transporter ATP-binding protein/permease [Clostridia bacterium]
MLELKNIVKEYVTADEKVLALKGVSLKFRKSEFVSVLGPSGCGKTTLLNIVGGLDRYTSGDLIINGKSTKNFSDKDWDTYRNHQIGFVFQSYNLIPHQTVLENVELALTLSGISAAERKERAIAVLEKVGLKNKINNRPNQLSGGQMQRVAIARALINDPEILLADEPTGALDSKTSVQIMDLLKEISNDRLIVMVTHNPELAEKYSSRIIRLLDGELVGDDKPVTDEEAEEENKISANETRTNKGRNKTSMSFFTALSLSFKNLMTKKARTFLVSFAGSIGIIGIALILSLSAGFQGYINRVQEETLSSYPITIYKSTTDYSAVLADTSENDVDAEEFPDSDEITANETFSHMLEAMNSAKITNDLVSLKKYLENYDKSKVTAIRYTYDISFDTYGKNEITGEENVKLQSVMDTFLKLTSSASSSSASMMSMMGMNVWSEAIDNESLIKSQYDIVGKGRWADFSRDDEIMVVVSTRNRIADYVLPSLGLMDPNELLYPMADTFISQTYRNISPEEKEKMIKAMGINKPTGNAKTTFTVDDIVGREFSIMLPSDYYVKNDDGTFSYMGDDEAFVKAAAEKAKKVKVVGVLRLKEGAVGGAFDGNIIYGKGLTHSLLGANETAPVIVAQKYEYEINVLTGEEFFGTEASYTSNMSAFGYVTENDISSISIYSSTFENKDYVVSLIDKYNEGKSDSDQIKYTDYLSILMSSITTIINAISYVLIGFVSVSLIVSSIMIGIITYISVLERIKEIGILRALGASKKDVSRVFNAETLIIGFTSGVIGIVISILLDIPISLLIYSLANIANVAALPVGGAIALVAISMLLTFIAGLIPSRIASKKDPVIALRSE